MLRSLMATNYKELIDEIEDKWIQKALDEALESLENVCDEKKLEYMFLKGAMYAVGRNVIKRGFE